MSKPTSVIQAQSLQHQIRDLAASPVTIASSKKLAELHFQLWQTRPLKSHIEPLVEALSAALGFPQNASDSSLWLKCALAYVSFGSYAETNDMLERICENNPRAYESSLARLLLAGVARKLGDPSGAVGYLLQLLQSDYKTIGLQQGHILFLLGSAYEQITAASASVLSRAAEAARHAVDAFAGAYSDFEASGLSSRASQSAAAAWKAWRTDSKTLLSLAHDFDGVGDVLSSCMLYLEAYRLHSQSAPASGDADGDTDLRTEWVKGSRAALFAGDTEAGDVFGAEILSGQRKLARVSRDPDEMLAVMEAGETVRGRFEAMASFTISIALMRKVWRLRRYVRVPMVDDVDSVPTSTNAVDVA